jgi:pyridoxal phosphate enzyme (YggS family)
MISVRDNCRRILERIHGAAARNGRDASSIRLIAVTKTVPAARVREAAESGISEIGENRVQEALTKRPLLADLQLQWHFIGHLQTNKAKRVVENFDWIQSVDRWELAEKLNQASRRRLPVLVEVELGNEETKAGVSEGQLPQLMESLKNCDRLDVRGFMAIPPFCEDPEKLRPYFARLRGLAARFRLAELSMGMSHDFEVAIAEGATMVRIGSALFGERS